MRTETAAKPKNLKKNRRFAFISHTADIGIRVSGKNIAQVFVNAAKGLAAYLKTGTDKKKIKVKVKIREKSYENLLVRWLNEILYLIYSKKVIFNSFKIMEITENTLLAEVSGNKIMKGHSLEREIKAVTYHDVKLRRAKNRYNTKLIFDI